TSGTWSGALLPEDDPASRPFWAEFCRRGQTEKSFAFRRLRPVRGAASPYDDACPGPRFLSLLIYWVVFLARCLRLAGCAPVYRALLFRKEVLMRSKKLLAAAVTGVLAAGTAFAATFEGR